MATPLLLFQHPSGHPPQVIVPDRSVVIQHNARVTKTSAHYDDSDGCWLLVPCTLIEDGLDIALRIIRMHGCNRALHGRAGCREELERDKTPTIIAEIYNGTQIVCKSSLATRRAGVVISEAQ